ncbi:hypothetical protein CPB85DRAFT_172381 [Mucidula mucida]|nr:hypothetical protein CPB85DRAFT_172381 [Mucidula mucida]
MASIGSFTLSIFMVPPDPVFSNLLRFQILRFLLEVNLPFILTDSLSTHLWLRSFCVDSFLSGSPVAFLTGVFSSMRFSPEGFDAPVVLAAFSFSIIRSIALAMNFSIFDYSRLRMQKSKLQTATTGRVIRVSHPFSQFR